MNPVKAVLSVRNFGFRFGSAIVASEMNLELPPQGITILMGPSGTGKSSFLRTLAGYNDSQPTFRQWGEYTYEGQPVAQGTPRPELVRQHVHLAFGTLADAFTSSLPMDNTRREKEIAVAIALNKLGEAAVCELVDRETTQLPTVVHRVAAIVRSTFMAPSVLFLDEPMNGLDDVEANRLIALIKRVSQRRHVVVCTHHEQRAFRLGGRVALLVGGTFREVGATRAFFRSPKTEWGRRFVRTRGPYVSPKDGSDHPALPRHPKHFVWLEEGRLGGTPRPGIIDDLADDLNGLQTLGIRRLICLEEQQPLDPSVLEKYGIESIHFPIPDMGVPDAQSLRELLERVRTYNDTKCPTAVHCLAGLGRTGLVLAASRIDTGEHPHDAIEYVRRLRPRMVQSEAQERFLYNYSLRKRPSHVV